MLTRASNNQQGEVLLEVQLNQCSQTRLTTNLNVLGLELDFNSHVYVQDWDVQAGTEAKEETAWSSM